MLVWLILYALVEAEARVYCQDSHANKWQPLGFSCPLNCGNIITAVNKLKSLDLKKIFSSDKEQLTLQNNSSVQFETGNNITNLNYDNNNIHDARSNTDENIKTYRRYYKILNNENVARDLKNEYKKAIAALKECYSINNVKNALGHKKCTRRYNVEDDFLRKFTDILNKYTNAVYPFTEELSGMILQKVLGKNMDLRHGLFNVNKILIFLSNAILTHQRNQHSREPVITLRSKNCVPVFVPGCFCKPGFVESSGQCVLPIDCFGGAVEHDLLARVIVH